MKHCVKSLIFGFLLISSVAHASDDQFVCSVAADVQEGAFTHRIGFTPILWPGPADLTWEAQYHPLTDLVYSYRSTGQSLAIIHAAFPGTQVAVQRISHFDGIEEGVRILVKDPTSGLISQSSSAGTRGTLRLIFAGRELMVTCWKLGTEQAGGGPTIQF